MTNHLGSVSAGVLTTLLKQSAVRAVHESKKGDMVIDNMSTYFLHPVQIESQIEIRPQIIEISRKFGKVDVEMFYNGQIVAKAMLTAQVFDQ
ncbi:hypothetical protein D3C87_1966950 [compost metagenome]